MIQRLWQFLSGFLMLWATKSDGGAITITPMENGFHESDSQVGRDVKAYRNNPAFAEVGDVEIINACLLILMETIADYLYEHDVVPKPDSKQAIWNKVAIETPAKVVPFIKAFQASGGDDANPTDMDIFIECIQAVGVETAREYAESIGAEIPSVA